MADGTPAELPHRRWRRTSGRMKSRLCCYAATVS